MQKHVGTKYYLATINDYQIQTKTPNKTSWYVLVFQEKFGRRHYLPFEVDYEALIYIGSTY